MAADAMMPLRMRGFTLVELLVTMVIALVVLGGLVMAFQSQYGHYKYQHRKADAVQDMDAVLRLLRQDLEGALVEAGRSSVSIAPDPYANPTLATTDLYATVWEPDLGFWGTGTNAVKSARRASYDFRAQRHWQYVAASESLKLDRNTRDGSDSPIEALADVTWFQVFPSHAPGGVDPYVDAAGQFSGTGIADLPPMDVYGQRLRDSSGSEKAVAQYTVLIEMKVPVGYKGGRKVDVHGNPTPEPRVHRYVQVHPVAAVAQ